MRIRWPMAAVCLVACAVFFLVGCGLDRRPIVIGSGVVTAAPAVPAERRPSADATPTAEASDDETATPTADESTDRTADTDG